jgi:hypothetical protein
MSAFRGKADSLAHLSAGPLIARSGHSSIPYLTPKVQAEIASVTVDGSHIPKYTSFFWLHLILGWVWIAVAIETRQGGICVKCQEVMSARSEALGVKFVPPMGWMKRSAFISIGP